MIRQITVRILRAVHAALGRWLAKADQPVAHRRCSFFDLPQGTLALHRDPDAEEIERWARQHNLPPRQ